MPERNSIKIEDSMLNPKRQLMEIRIEFSTGSFLQVTGVKVCKNSVIVFISVR